MTVASQTASSMVVTVDGATATQSIPVSPAWPAIFSGGVLNQDSSVNGPGATAKAGDILQIFLTGMPDNAAVSVVMGNQNGIVPVYAGAAPGINGVEQVNVAIPAGAGGGSTPVAICATAGGRQSVSRHTGLREVSSRSIKRRGAEALRRLVIVFSAHLAPLRLNWFLTRSFAAALAAICLFASGCGYIGGTLPPLANIPGDPTELSVIQRGGDLFVHFKLPPLTTELKPIRGDLELDLRAGVTPSPWNLAAWAAAAKKIVPLSVKDGLAQYRFQIRGMDGQRDHHCRAVIGANGKPSNWSNIATVPVVGAAAHARRFQGSGHGEGRPANLARARTASPHSAPLGRFARLCGDRDVHNAGISRRHRRVRQRVFVPGARVHGSGGASRGAERSFRRADAETEGRISPCAAGRLARYCLGCFR